MDFFGLTPEGHPNPSRVALHDDWPDGAWPLRKDFPIDRIVPRVAGDFHPFRPVTGEGVFQIPVGPVHAGVIEPGHFRFGVAGEPVLYLQLRLFYVHKGTEKRFERMPWRHGLYLAESISGDTAVGHALAYAQAIERLAGVTAPPRAQALRVVLLELERIYNHTADIGALATDVAFTVPASRAQALREGLVRLYDRLFGTRLLRGTVALGGVKRDLSPRGGVRRAARAPARRSSAGSTIWSRCSSTPARSPIASTGPARSRPRRPATSASSAWPRAPRASTPIAAATIRSPPTTACGSRCRSRTGGDVRARLMVRAREVEQSLSILFQVLDALPDTPLVAPLPDRLPASASALGWAEAWRGPCTHWIATDERGEVARVKVTDPSFLNWPGLAHAVPGNIVPDFPVINKSFNLSYSGQRSLTRRPRHT